MMLFVIRKLIIVVYDMGFSHWYSTVRVECVLFFFFFQAEDGIRDLTVTGVQTCALPISSLARSARSPRRRPDRNPGRAADGSGGRRLRAGRSAGREARPDEHRRSPGRDRMSVV